MTKKNNHYALTARADSMSQIFAQLGYEANLVSPECIMAKGEKVNLYCDFRCDRIFFGKSGKFDRWANSRDYVFDGISEDRNDIALVLKMAEDMAAKGISHGDDFEPVVLNQWWRQYKKAAARVESIQDAGEETKCDVDVEDGVVLGMR